MIRKRSVYEVTKQSNNTQLDELIVWRVRGGAVEQKTVNKMNKTQKELYLLFMMKLNFRRLPLLIRVSCLPRYKILLDLYKLVCI